MMNGITIRIGTTADAEWATGMMARSEPWIKLGTTPDQLLKTFHHPEYQVHVAMADDHAAGLLIVHPRGLASSPYIKSIAVASSFQNRGIGEQLMAFAERHYGRESKHLFLCVSSFNLRAQKFYRRLGYETVAEFRDYVIEGESELLLHKRIS